MSTTSDQTDTFLTIPTNFSTVVPLQIVLSIIVFGVSFIILQAFQHNSSNQQLLSIDSIIAILITLIFFALFFHFRSYTFSIKEKAFLVYSYRFLYGSWKSYPFKEVTGINIKSYARGGRGGGVTTALNLRCSDGKIYVLTTASGVQYYGKQISKILHIPLRQEGQVIYSPKQSSQE